jgi:hypothetical protein
MAEITAPFDLAAVNIAGQGAYLSGGATGNIVPPPAFTADATAASFDLTSVSSVAELYVGEPISGSVIPVTSTISAISGTTVTFTNTGINPGTGEATGIPATADATDMTVTPGVGPTTGFMLQAGTSGLTFTSGVASLTFPYPFLQGLLAVVATPVVASVEAALVALDSSTVSLSGCDLAAEVAGSALTGALTVSWVAIGC